MSIPARYENNCFLESSIFKLKKGKKIFIHSTCKKENTAYEIFGTHSFSFRAYNYADPSSYSGPDQKHHYNEQNENPYDYVAPRQNSAPRSRTSPNQNAVYARPYASPDRHSREGSYDRGRSFMNQIYMDTEQLQKLRVRQENHPPTSNHGNREVMGARDSGYPGPERPR